MDSLCFGVLILFPSMELTGEEILGFNREDIVICSTCSGGAVTMILSRSSVIIIYIVGRWLSKVFLGKEQVETYTLIFSKNMVKYKELFNLNFYTSNTIANSNLKAMIHITQTMKMAGMCFLFVSNSIN